MSDLSDDVVVSRQRLFNVLGLCWSRLSMLGYFDDVEGAEDDVVQVARELQFWIEELRGQPLPESGAIQLDDDPQTAHGRW